MRLIWRNQEKAEYCRRTWTAAEQYLLADSTTERQKKSPSSPGAPRSACRSSPLDRTVQDKRAGSALHERPIPATRKAMCRSQKDARQVEKWLQMAQTQSTKCVKHSSSGAKLQGFQNQ